MKHLDIVHVELVISDLRCSRIFVMNAAIERAPIVSGREMGW